MLKLQIRTTFIPSSNVSPNETVIQDLSPLSSVAKTSNGMLNFKEQVTAIKPQENLEMPLIFLPKSPDNNPWNSIASDILRSIHSEYSFAKKSDFGFKTKQPKRNEKLSYDESDQIKHPTLTITSGKSRNPIIFFKK